MKGDDKVIASLNALLGDELAATNQYILHAEICENWRYGKLHEILMKRAIEEMKHAEMIIARILFLEGRPVVSQLGAIGIGSDVQDMHKKDWTAESRAIGNYNAAIKLMGESGDGGTRELMEAILADEESHIDWIEGQQGQIAQMGVEIYLGRQE
jgi:bacterioferritin